MVLVGELPAGGLYGSKKAITPSLGFGPLAFSGWIRLLLAEASRCIGFGYPHPPGLWFYSVQEPVPQLFVLEVRSGFRDPVFAQLSSGCIFYWHFRRFFILCRRSISKVGSPFVVLFDHYCGRHLVIDSRQIQCLRSGVAFVFAVCRSRFFYGMEKFPTIKAYRRSFLGLLFAGPILVYGSCVLVSHALGMDVTGARTVPYRDNALYFLWPPKNGDYGPRMYAERALDSASRDSVILADYTLWRPLRYKQIIEGDRKDLEIVLVENIIENGGVVAYLDGFAGKKPFTSQRTLPSPTINWIRSLRSIVLCKMGMCMKSCRSEFLISDETGVNSL